jgi:hypothetical protein
MERGYDLYSLAISCLKTAKETQTKQMLVNSSINNYERKINLLARNISLTFCPELAEVSKYLRTEKERKKEKRECNEK